MSAVARPVLRAPMLLPLGGPRNPSFEADRGTIRREGRRMRESPVALPRPVVVLAGWRSPPTVGYALAEYLAGLTSGRSEHFVPISYTLRGDIERIASIVRARLERAALYARARAVGAGSSGESAGNGGDAGDGDPLTGIELDVVAVSMGGLVARRLAAEPVGGREPLRIRRLMTISTPHRGAKLARLIRLDAASRAMRPGSAFLARLDEALESAPFELTCYAQLNDRMVGARNTAPPGRVPLWTPGVRLVSHYATTQNRLVLLDIARRLRGEPPIGQPGQPPPTD